VPRSQPGVAEGEGVLVGDGRDVGGTALGVAVHAGGRVGAGRTKSPRDGGAHDCARMDRSSREYSGIA